MKELDDDFKNDHVVPKNRSFLIHSHIDGSIIFAAVIGLIFVMIGIVNGFLANRDFDDLHLPGCDASWKISGGDKIDINIRDVSVAIHSTGVTWVNGVQLVNSASSHSSSLYRCIVKKTEEDVRRKALDSLRDNLNGD